MSRPQIRASRGTDLRNAWLTSLKQTCITDKINRVTTVVESPVLKKSGVVFNTISVRRLNASQSKLARYSWPLRNTQRRARRCCNAKVARSKCVHSTHFGD